MLIAHNFSHCLLTNRLQAQPGQLQQSLLPIHSAAQSQIQMARAARKNGLVNVALDMLTRYVSFYWPCCRTKLTAMFSDGNVSGGEKWEGGGGNEAATAYCNVNRFRTFQEIKCVRPLAGL